MGEKHKPNRFRIYLGFSEDGRVQQAMPYTDLFFDVDQEQQLEYGGNIYYKVVGTSRGIVARTLADATPDGIDSGAQLNALGARMCLHGKRWYVEAGDVLLCDGTYMPDTPVTPLRLVLLGLSLAVGVFLLVSRFNGWDVRAISAGGGIIGALLLAADMLSVWWREKML